MGHHVCPLAAGAGVSKEQYAADQWAPASQGPARQEFPVPHGVGYYDGEGREHRRGRTDGRVFGILDKGVEPVT